MINVEIENGVCVVKITRPESLNALNSSVLSGIEKVCDSMSKQTRGLVLTGEGRAFSAGADIREIYNLRTRSEARGYALRGQRVLSKVENLRVPSVAAINGYALGAGLELALSCTFRIASAGAKLGLPEIHLGVIPGYGGTQRLTKLAGIGVARRIILTGEPVTAEEALRLGIVDFICEGPELLDRAKGLVKGLSEKSPAAFRYANEACLAAQFMSLDEGMKLEADFCSALIVSPEAKRKMEKFLKT